MHRRWMGLVAMLAVLALVAAGCSKSKKTGTPSASGSSGCTPIAQVTTLGAGTLTIGSDIPYPPFEFNDSAGNLTGFDVELMNAVAAKLCLAPDWKNTNFNTIFTSLAANKFDTIASAVTAYAPQGSPAYTVVQQRAQIVAFAKAYYPSLQSLAVNVQKTPDITTVDQLPSGAKVGVQRGTTGEFWAKDNLEPKGITLVSYVKAPDMYTALQAGQLVGVINDLPVAEDIVKNRPSLKIVQQIDTGEQYAFAVNKSNTGLLDGINKALDALFADGTYTTIFKKYFPTQELPSYAAA